MTDETQPGYSLARLLLEEALGETAYRKMYDVAERYGVTGHYSDVKDHLGAAIAIARHLGRTADVDRLSARLAEIKTIFRQQFPQ